MGAPFPRAVAEMPRERAEPEARAEPTFAEFYAQHLPFVWRNVLRLVGPYGAVDDIVQDVFLVALRRLPEFEGRSSASTWLYGILRRVIKDHRRSASRRGQRASVDWEVLADPEAHDSVERQQVLRTLHEVLATLEEGRRDVFILAELEGMTAAEIAEVLGIKESTVYGRLRDARRDFEAAAQRHRARDRRGR